MASSLPGSLSPLHSMIRHLVHGHGAAQNAVGCAYAMRSLSTGGIVRNGSSPDPEGPQDREYEPPTIKVTSITRKRGMDILHDPWYNKGTAFPKSERDRLGLRGLLPPRELTADMQESRFMYDYNHGVTMIPPDEVKTGGVTDQMAFQWRQLQRLQDRNETLFYRVLLQHFVDMAPIVYTPTVGWVCVNYHKLYRRPRGMYFSAQDRGEMAAMVYNWPQEDVHAIVVTDGSRILGLGDLGVNGLGIPIGKLDLYCAAAGFHPGHVLPCVIDVGTNNEALRADPLYMGLQQPRIQGPEYFAIVDEFVSAVMDRWPNAVLQFEDFSNEHALVLLERYRQHHLVFNDDIQGTAATALAGLYGAMRRMGKPLSDLAKQRVVCVGAGSAGMGVVRMIAAGMEKQGATPEQAAENFWVLDNRGLITCARQDLPPHVAPFARPCGDQEGRGLLGTIRKIKPTVLLGLAGAGRLFTPEILAEVAKYCEAPIIFPMSNPTSKMECTHEEAVVHTGGRAVFASGSPQPDVQYNGQSYPSSQANNMYIFPGIALGAFLGRTRIVTDAMLMAAAEKLPQLISEEDLARGCVYPGLQSIRDISTAIALEVIKAAAAQGRVKGPALEQLDKGDARLERWIRRNMFTPNYKSLVSLPVGE